MNIDDLLKDLPPPPDDPFDQRVKDQLNIEGGIASFLDASPEMVKKLGGADAFKRVEVRVSDVLLNVLDAQSAGRLDPNDVTIITMILASFRRAVVDARIRTEKGE